MTMVRSLRADSRARNWLARNMLTSWIVCLSIGALAQTPKATGSLPDAPSATTSSAVKSIKIDHSLTFGQRVKVYRKSVFNPLTIVLPALAAGIGQWQDEPPGWKQGADGYGRRIGSNIGRNVIAKTIVFGIAAIDGEDPRYFRSQDRSFMERVKHGIVSTFVSSTASGRQIPAFSRFAGIYGASFISNAWYPDERATAGYAARRGSTALGAYVGLRVASEFLPFLRSTDK
jgi:hypothetical protein